LPFFLITGHAEAPVGGAASPTAGAGGVAGARLDALFPIVQLEYN
jgi:hypothetical protein